VEQLLTTKLYIPPTRPELVPRPRLIDKLNEGLHRKLTLISAPAGFGKTTLVTEWLDNVRLDAKNETQAENKIAWLSLDEGDNDLARFLTYFVAALNHIEEIDVTFGKGTLSMLLSPQPPPIETILTSLINEFAAISVRIIFVLDDIHLIETQPIHDALIFLVEHLPPQMHLVFATREDPHLPLARLRSQDQLTELRVADLRFTSSEAAEFLNQVMGLDLSEEDIVALETRTEGWIAGLQLAAISLQGKEDTTKLIKSFSGSHRLVLDYLFEEVLDQQSESVQIFLLQTAILDRLTGSLCDAVRFGKTKSPSSSEGTALTGQDNGQEILLSPSLCRFAAAATAPERRLLF
jgi:LuxR family maltose regulon positive regulatory protein